jgi:Cu-processing system permease protein
VEAIMIIPARAAVAAACQRELAANRVNRFLHVHLALAASAGLLPLFTPDDVGTAAPLWALHAVLYCLSLSALLLGLSSAHGEADEFALLFTQPVPRWAWLLGKAAGLSVVLVPASILLVLPAAFGGGLTPGLAGLAAAASGITLALAAIGLAVGFWVRDPVRSLLTALGTWFALLFGADLLLLALSGAPWLQQHPGLWVALLMANPLDALRITVIFDVEHAAFAGLDGGGLVTWWLEHGWVWLALVIALWTTGGFATGLAGARRRLDA